MLSARNLDVGQLNVTYVAGNYIDYMVKNTTGLPGGSDNPYNTYSRPCYGTTIYDEPLRVHVPKESRKAVPFPSQSPAPDQGQQLAYTGPRRAYKRKRTTGSGGSLYGAVPRTHAASHCPLFSDVANIGVLNQTIHQCVKSHTAPIDRLLEHVVDGAAHDSAERSDAPKCHPKTREAVQDEVLTWTQDGKDEDPSRTLWITGPAGAGKTAIAGTIADKCHADGSLAASFFFSACSKTPGRRSKTGLIPTLAYHLTQHERIVGFKDELLASIDRDPKIFEKCLARQVESLILKPLRKIRGLSDPSTWPKVIIVDGLDECEADLDRSSTHPTTQGEDKGQPNHTAGTHDQEKSKESTYEEIVSALIQAVKDASFPFRLIVVSRPEPAIRALFPTAAPSSVRELFLGDKYKPDADITRFLKAKFAKLREAYVLPKQWPGQPVVRKLVKNASGQFVYVTTAMRFIESGHPMEQLKVILAWDGDGNGEKEGQCPLAQLDDLYTRIINRSSDPLLVVKWLHALLELQTENHDSPTMVKAFLESKPGETRHVLRNLSSLVNVTDEGTAFRFFHKSLLDFLVSPGRSGKLYVDSETTVRFLQDRWYKLLKNRGPQIPLEASERRFFLRHYVESFTMRYFYLPGEGRNYEPSDVAWWTDICFELLSSSYHQLRVEGVYEIVHEKCQGPWFMCDPDCKVWRSRLRTPTFHQMLHSHRRRRLLEGKT